MTDKRLEKKAVKFIKKLQKLTVTFSSMGITPAIVRKTVALDKYLKCFAIVDEFDSWKIVDVYNEVKISLLKWNRFADKENPECLQLKAILDSMFALIEDLYYYEIFGFFSTGVHPDEVPELRLPCYIRVGCADGWQREPYLKKDGTVGVENVIRFANKDKHDLLCMTISDEPEILEGREKCVLSDEQINNLKDFVRQNKDIIVLHNAGVIDSKDFVDALKIIRLDEGKTKCCFCGSVFDGNGNSTWPIYYKEDGERNRCCDECNSKYVVASRTDKTLIMKFRKQFGINYESYTD